MNHYEAKQADRKARLEARAVQAEAQAATTYDRAKQMGEAIPFGQPILVGHHSEGRDRNYRQRIHSTYGKAFDLQKKADHYVQKAAAVGDGGVSSDDPDAISKLMRQVEQLTENQERMKKSNQVIRKYKGDAEGQRRALLELGYSEESAQKLIAPDYAGRAGFPSFTLTNNNANIRRIGQRIKQLQADQERAPVSIQGTGYAYAEDVEENRVMFMFEGKPDKSTREILKRHGFRWSPTRGAWVRQLNNAAIWQAKAVMQILNGSTDN
ncbi:DUF3560 domain-containing protein [Bordetella petrii]|uniref:Conjugal transfer protein TraC n=1 Tax=Bordetella petrii (strain ATCC BAA-461 / DSM 12804 / CCUG 43448 / CIP 107267 / Se-1111R) TaxID=340100 RepID=A9I302_BORPD|nr:DUF3560 domain-containing protein [Bordetella petrii]CAP44115.1 conserved hypothetical protein [Bordetella petrii]